MFVNLLDVKIGQRIVMKNQSVAEVVENLGDGIWVTGRFVESPSDPSIVGTEELCYCEEIVKILDPA